MMNSSLMARVLFGASVLLAALAVAAPVQAAGSAGSDLLDESCAVNCFGLEERDQTIACLLACDGVPTLSSEEAVRLGLAAPGTGEANVAGACHTPGACPPEYSSCAGWSPFTGCGDPICGTYKFCPDPPFCEEPDLCFGPATYLREERFRVCFNAQGQSCTQYQQLVYPATCDC